MGDHDQASAEKELSRLIEIVAKLRGPDGCPWDIEQTSESMIPFLLEEAYEVVETIETGDTNELKSELGDLLLHIVMQAQIADETSKFKLQDSIRSINEKLIRRHPHVFGENNSKEKRIEDAKENWEKAKQSEGRKSWIDGVPKNLPGLIRAQRVQEKASNVGFDWDDVMPALEKCHEEIDELIEVWREGDQERSKEEFGDVLFSLVNVGRLMKLDSESSMRLAVDKFDARFRALENEFEDAKRDLVAASLEEMDEVWDRIKHNVNYRK